MLFCPVCKEEGINGKVALKLHVYEQHGMGEVFRCEDCSFQTPSKTAFTRHADACPATVAANKFRCPHCDKVFKSKAGLNLHVKLHVGGQGVRKASIEISILLEII